MDQLSVIPFEKYFRNTRLAVAVRRVGETVSVCLYPQEVCASLLKKKVSLSPGQRRSVLGHSGHGDDSSEETERRRKYGYNMCL